VEAQCQGPAPPDLLQDRGSHGSSFVCELLGAEKPGMVVVVEGADVVVAFEDFIVVVVLFVLVVGVVNGKKISGV